MGICNSKSIQKELRESQNRTRKLDQPVGHFTQAPAPLPIQDSPFLNANIIQGHNPKENQPQSSKKNLPKKPKRPKVNYSIFDEIKDAHSLKMRTYKRPEEKSQAPQQHDMYAPHINAENGNKNKLDELDSYEYEGSNYSDKRYYDSIPKKKSGTGVRFDETKTIFFKGGSSPVYSESILVLQGYDDVESTWVDIEDPSYRVQRRVTYGNGYRPFDLEQYVMKYAMQAGWFVMIKDRWGFLLNLDSITEAYQGHLHKRWKVLLEETFFFEMVEKFGGFMEDLHAEKQGIQGVLPREIPTTDFDAFLSEGFISGDLHSKLFLHQKQEVGWMFDLENYPAIRMKKTQSALPFLDSGYYIDPENLAQGFIKLDDKDDFVDIFVPGGILASQIGSGKTVTTIALGSIGSHLVGKKKGKAEDEETKLSDIANDSVRNKRKLNGLLNGVYEPSMIIVTENILKQWEEEFKKFCKKLTVIVVETEKDLPKLQFKDGKLSNCDIILTHRLIIEKGNELFAKHCPQIFRTSFRRVIMDEFHELTAYMTEQALAAEKGKDYKGAQLKHNMIDFCRTLSKIERKFTWGITGTPDSLNYYAEAEPLFILLNLNHEYKNTASTFAKFKDEFVSACMRKNPRSVDLPRLSKSVQNVYFGQIQNILYKGKLNYALDKKAAEEICSHLLKQWRKLDTGEKDYIQVGIETIRKRQQEEILTLQNLLKERGRKEDNEILQKRLETLRSEGNFFEEVIRLISQKSFECPVCLVEYEANDIVVTECLHNLCAGCYDNLQRSLSHPQCPVCRDFIQGSGLVIHPKFATTKENKLTAIIKALNATPREDKVIIFTQFQSLVEHLTDIFIEVGIPFIVLRGSPTEINISLTNFKYDPDIKVLLMSVEQAASGINVQEANHVFFAHPVFGLEFEKAAITYNQCIGRAYRVGQIKDVDVKLFVTKDSLEEDLVSSFNKYAHPF